MSQLNHSLIKEFRSKRTSQREARDETVLGRMAKSETRSQLRHFAYTLSNISAPLLLFALPLTMASTISLGASPTCERLMDEISSKQDRLIGFGEMYECGPDFKNYSGEKLDPVEGCLLFYQYDASPYPNYTVGAFLDSANEHQVNWLVADSRGWFSGTEVNGYRICADVKTYVHAHSAGDTYQVIVRKSTAADAMFCPFWKLFASYEISCNKVP